MKSLINIKRSVEKFSKEISKEFYLQGAGLKSDIDFDSIYDKYPDLFTSENLLKIASELEKNVGKSNNLRRLKLFTEAFYNEILGAMTKDLISEFLNKEAGGIVRLSRSRNLSYRSSVVELLSEHSRAKREKLRKAINKYTGRKINPTLERLFHEERIQIGKMGFGNKIEMFENLSGVDLHKLNDMMQEFVSRTDDLYACLLKSSAKKKLGLEPGQLRKHDLLYLMKGKQYDRLFPENAMLKTITGFTNRMGLGLKENKNIIVDIEARQNKSPRAFCSPVRIPEEVYLVIYPRGGEDDYTSFLHELGHALHFSNIDKSLEFEYKWFGDNSVTEGFAMLFDHLTMNESWTKRNLGFDSRIEKNYFRHRYFNELIMLRRYAAKLSYELALNRDDKLENKQELYVSVFEKMTKVRYAKENYLIDVDPNFYCARYLRAWMFQSNLTKYLKEGYGNTWFENKEAGKKLRNFWQMGQKYNADEFMAKNGCDPLTPEPLYQDISSYLMN